MERFRNKMTVPPGNEYFYEVKETSTKIISPDMYSLMDKVRRHCATNNIKAPENLEAEIEHYMCRFMPEGFCFGESTEKHTPWYTPSKIRDASVAMFHVFTKGDDAFALEHVAKNRGVTCSSCPENNRSVCTTCDGLLGFAKRFVKGRSTDVDKYVGVCDVCGCMLAIKIHMSDEVLKKLIKRPYPAHCWMYKLGRSTLEKEQESDEENL